MPCRAFSCVLSISFRPGETGETPETDAQSAGTFAVPPASRTRDREGKAPQSKDWRSGRAALIFDAEPSIDLLLPLAAFGYVIAPRSAFALANGALERPEALPGAEHVGARLAETVRA